MYMQSYVLHAVYTGMSEAKDSPFVKDTHANEYNYYNRGGSCSSITSSITILHSYNIVETIRSQATLRSTAFFRIIQVAQALFPILVLAPSILQCKIFDANKIVQNIAFDFIS